MKNYLIVTLLFLLLGTYSCKKEAPVKSPENFPDTPVGNFEAFWHGMSRYYAFWEYEKTDWDKIYDEYSKKVNENTTPEELQKYIGEMIRELRDHHLNVKGAINDTPFVLVPRRMINNYQQYHFLLDQDYFENTIYNKLDVGDRNKYLGFVYGTLNGKYQYVHFPQFNISSWAATNPQFVLGMINFLAKPQQKHKGVIVDLRANAGGNSDEISLLVGNFIDKKLEHGSIKVKYGPGRNDFSPWLPEYVYPNTRPETQGYNPLPIVVLCDRLTGSNGELSTMVFSLLPQATILGDTTFGAYGAVAGPGSRKEVFGGTFKLPNGWEVSMASNVFRFKDGNVYEGIGFPPEILLPLDENQFAQGKDNQLEAALNILPK